MSRASLTPERKRTESEIKKERNDPDIVTFLYFPYLYVSLRFVVIASL
jgi:hypothetical protein